MYALYTFSIRGEFMINTEIIDDVYYSLQGVLMPEARIPWVKDLFLPGSLCDLAYSHMLDAYERLRDRLGVPDEDADVETIINSLMEIQGILSREMFRCGLEYARREAGEQM